MKNLKTLAMFVLINTNVLGQNDPIDVWLPWSCQAGLSVGVVSTGNHKAMIQFTSPWEEGVRDVWYSYPVMGAGTQWAYYGQVGPGVNLFEVSHLTNMPYFYWHDLTTALAFVDPENPGAEALVTAPVTIRTEPAPHLTVEVVDQANTEATLRIRSWSQISQSIGFGGMDMSICPEFSLSVEVRVNDWENGVETTHIINAIPGLPTDQLLVIQNPNNIATELCINAQLVRSHDSLNPVFDPRVITTSGGDVCVTLSGDLTTAINEVSVMRRAPFPNPFTDQIKLNADGEWFISNMLGQTIMVGWGEQTISTETWKPGAYMFRTLSGSSFVIVKE